MFRVAKSCKEDMVKSTVLTELGSISTTAFWDEPSDVSCGLDDVDLAATIDKKRILALHGLDTPFGGWKLELELDSFFEGTTLFGIPSLGFSFSILFLTFAKYFNLSSLMTWAWQQLQISNMIHTKPTPKCNEISPKHNEIALQIITIYCKYFILSCCTMLLTSISINSIQTISNIIKHHIWSLIMKIVGHRNAGGPGLTSALCDTKPTCLQFCVQPRLMSAAFLQLHLRQLQRFSLLLQPAPCCLHHADIKRPHGFFVLTLSSRDLYN